MSIDFDRLQAALAQRYALERQLEEGGMALVYLARDLKHSRQVAGSYAPLIFNGRSQIPGGRTDRT